MSAPSSAVTRSSTAQDDNNKDSVPRSLVVSISGYVTLAPDASIIIFGFRGRG